MNVAEIDGSQSYWMLPISQTLKLFTLFLQNKVQTETFYIAL
jgi:hypothetical protein